MAAAEPAGTGMCARRALLGEATSGPAGCDLLADAIECTEDVSHSGWVRSDIDD